MSDDTNMNGDDPIKALQPGDLLAVDIPGCSSSQAWSVVAARKDTAVCVVGQQRGWAWISGNEPIPPRAWHLPDATRTGVTEGHPWMFTRHDLPHDGEMHSVQMLLVYGTTMENTMTAEDEYGGPPFIVTLTDDNMLGDMISFPSDSGTLRLTASILDELQEVVG